MKNSPMFATIKTLLRLHDKGILSESRLSEALEWVTNEKLPAL